MNSDRLSTVAVAVLCLFVIGSAAGTLESSVHSSPADAINLDYAHLPISMDQAREVREKYNSMTKQKPDPQDNPDQPPDSKSVGTPNAQSDPNQAQATAQASKSDAKTEQSKSGPDEPSLLDRLLAFLEWLLSVLVKVVAAVVVLLGLALAVRYRSRLWGRLRALLVRYGLLSPAEDGDGAETAPETTPDPRNDVSRAWYEMARRLGLDHDGPLTPRERAHLAEKRGADPTTVQSLTRLFEEVQYGGAPITEQRRQLAEHHLQRFRQQTEGGGSNPGGPGGGEFAGGDD